jgi:hypothetical protein
MEKAEITESSQRGQPVEPELLGKLATSGQARYPANHEAAMQVPKGGSSCATCKYLGAGNTCKNAYFIEYNGGNKLPYPADEFCSDWYEWKR